MLQEPEILFPGPDRTKVHIHRQVLQPGEKRSPSHVCPPLILNNQNHQECVKQSNMLHSYALLIVDNCEAL